MPSRKGIESTMAKRRREQTSREKKAARLARKRERRRGEIRLPEPVAEIDVRRWTHGEHEPEAGRRNEGVK